MDTTSLTAELRIAFGKDTKACKETIAAKTSILKKDAMQHLGRLMDQLRGVVNGRAKDPNMPSWKEAIKNKRKMTADAVLEHAKSTIWQDKIDEWVPLFTELRQANIVLRFCFSFHYCDTIAWC